MLKIYAEKNARLIDIHAGEIPAASPVWIDLLEPTPDEEIFVEDLIGTEIPTRDEIREIEISSSLYQEGGAIFTTASMLTHSETPEPEIHRVSFILARNILVTLRYIEPKAFTLFANKVRVTSGDYSTGGKVLIDLLETIIARAADTLENAAHDIDLMNKEVFRPSETRKRKDKKQEKKDEKTLPPVDFKQALVSVGGVGDLISKVNESLLSLARLISYVEHTPVFHDRAEDIRRLNVVLKDVLSLREYAGFLSDKVIFLLDATLGMIGIEQSNIIKIFSVAATLFLPPTLIASIYGMNFHHMPELAMPFGYPFSIGLMALSAYLPYRFFKKRGWL
jgi:magnesium transporter